MQSVITKFINPRSLIWSMLSKLPRSSQVSHGKIWPTDLVGFLLHDLYLNGGGVDQRLTKFEQYTCTCMYMILLCVLPKILNLEDNLSYNRILIKS